MASLDDFVFAVRSLRPVSVQFNLSVFHNDFWLQLQVKRSIPFKLIFILFANKCPVFAFNLRSAWYYSFDNSTFMSRYFQDGETKLVFIHCLTKLIVLSHPFSIDLIKIISPFSHYTID